MKLSVIILTKNNQETIEECLNSVINSEIENYEIIVVDAHSKDNTLEIVKKYTKNIFYDTGKGISEARNIGIKNSLGVFLLFLDADAYVEKNCIKEMLKEFEDEKVAGVQCNPKPVIKTQISRTVGEGWLSFHEKFHKSGKYNNPKYIGGPCLMFRKKQIEEVSGFDEKIRYGNDDYDVSYRIYKNGWKFVVLKEMLCYHHPRHTLNELIKEYSEWAVGTVIFLKKFPKFYKENNISLITSKIFSPIQGVMLSIKYKNPMHLILYPLTRWIWLVSYFKYFIKSLLYFLEL